MVEKSVSPTRDPRMDPKGCIEFKDVTIQCMPLSALLENHAFQQNLRSELRAKEHSPSKSAPKGMQQQQGQEGA